MPDDADPPESDAPAGIGGDGAVDPDRDGSADPGGDAPADPGGDAPADPADAGTAESTAEPSGDPGADGPLATTRRLAVAAVWNADRRRLRTPWRLALAAVVFVVATLLVGTGLLAAGVGRPASVTAGQFVGTAIAATATAAVVAVSAVLLDRRRLRDYGLGLDRDWAIDCAFGLGLGVALVSAVAGVMAAAGWLTVRGTFVSTGGAFVPTLGSLLALFVLVGVYEELLARGYLLTNVAEGLAPLGDRAAVALATLLSSGLFGAAHASNPGATAVSTATVSLAGVVLALGYLLTDELAIPIGFHVSWNASLGVGYGLPVSGLRPAATLLETGVDGPTVLTGGSFGPEAGLLGVAALLVGIAAIVAWVRWRYGAVGLAPGVVEPELRWRE
jgi:hypothetical protein